jgi:exodeoxyribonuclease V alpha subunit
VRSSDAGGIVSGYADHPVQRLAEAFALRAQGWARRRNAAAADLAVIGRAARLLSLATSSGHVCIDLGEIAAATAPPADAGALRAALLRSGLVATPAAPDRCPMILDDDGRLYLHRYFDYETRLARRIAAFSRTTWGADIGPGSRALLDDLFAANAARLAGRTDWQKLAAALALLRGLTVVSGGPGTGKTTAVVNLLACLLDRDPACRVALAAPTGKAAARMLDALRERAAHLPAEIRARLPQDSYTIHRLLGVTPDGGRFRHHQDNPLAIDVLVVDEASMLDLSLATRLLEAVPPAARVVLLGDKDQLAAVESGAVFAELCADPTLSAPLRQRLAEVAGSHADDIRPPPPAVPSPLQDSVVWFADSYRFSRNSGIGRLASAINAGDADTVVQWLRAGGDDSVGWEEDAASSLPAATLADLADGYAPYIEALRHSTTDLPALFSAFGAYRVLCAVRDGPRGVDFINTQLAGEFRRRLDPTLPVDTRAEWYAGRPVMVLENDYVLKLFNGDIGIALPDSAGRLLVHFPAGQDGYRALPPPRLPRHETAFAMTVHKSQGSEFDAVRLILPASSGGVLSRELLYTAVTRARQRVGIVGGEAVLRQAIMTPTRRHSGLMARMRGAPD